MASTPNNRNRKSSPGRPQLPGRYPAGGPRPPNFIEQARGQPRARMRTPAAPSRTPAGRGTPLIRVDETQRAPGTAPPAEVQAPPPRRPASNIEELAPQIVRFAIKRDDGLTGTEFDEKLLPRVKAMIPADQQANEREVLQEYLLSVAHALYVAIIVGQFSARPVLCAVRAAELAADLAERILHQVGSLRERRLMAIRCQGLLAGLALYAVRFLETTILNSASLRGFTDNFERAVIATYGLKSQAEAAGMAPWARRNGNPLEKRIGQAVNTMSGMFGDYIGQYGGSMDEQQHDEVVREFNGFMERFASYIEGGSADEKRRRLVKHTASIPRPHKVEPLEIKDVRARPAGVEIALADGRTLFVSRDDSRRIGKAAEAEAEDTAKREREAMEAKLKATPQKN